MIPNYSKPDDWEKFNALGVSQYGQMTAGSYMYIGPQGIVHGTTITVLNALRRFAKTSDNPGVKLFVTAGLGGMSGAQPKAGNIAGVVSITAEVNPKAVHTRHSQGWVDEVISEIPELSLGLGRLYLRMRSSLLHILAMLLMFGKLLIRKEFLLI